MPPKRKKSASEDGGALTDKQFASCVMSSATNIQVTKGAMEALRLAHGHFLSLLAMELALLHEKQDEELGALIQPNHIQECLNRLGLQQCAVDPSFVSTTSAKSRQPRKKKQKKFHVTADLLQQQEDLLNQSRLRAKEQAKSTRERMKPK